MLTLTAVIAICPSVCYMANDSVVCYELHQYSLKFKIHASSCNCNI